MNRDSHTKPDTSMHIHSHLSSSLSEHICYNVEKWDREQRSGLHCAWERGGQGHDRQEKLLMDSCDSCDLWLKDRQVPPLRK